MLRVELQRQAADGRLAVLLLQQLHASHTQPFQKRGLKGSNLTESYQIPVMFNYQLSKCLSNCLCYGVSVFHCEAEKWLKLYYPKFSENLVTGQWPTDTTLPVVNFLLPKHTTPACHRPYLVVHYIGVHSCDAFGLIPMFDVHTHAQSE